MSPADGKYFTEIRNLSYQLHPRLMNLTPGSDAEPGLTVVSFSAEVETEVETIYRRMYDGDISIDQVIEMLQESKNSSATRENEIFACTLHSLFDEYKFLQSS
jgi:CCR4-NOT transcription complex subunit 1